MNRRSYNISPEEAGKRIDVFLTAETGLNRTEVQKWIKEGGAQVGGKTVRSNYRIAEGEDICFEWEEKQPFRLLPEELPLDILYEDEYMLVINKRRGMVVHPAPGNMSGTLVNALLFHCGGQLSDVGGADRPGIVHRLDKDTSGVMVAAKTNEAHRVLAGEIAAHTARRCYTALVHGQMEGDRGVIRFPLGRSTKDRLKWTVDPRNGRTAVTHYQVLEYLPAFSWVSCRLETGRTHQIRVHMAYIGHPVVQDPLYGWKKDHFPISGQALHSSTLDLIHPVTGQQMHFEAPIPDDMTACLEMARTMK